MSSTAEVLSQPLFLFSMLAILGAAGWAVYYLRRGASDSAENSLRVSGQARVPVAAQAMVSPPGPARAPEENPSVPRVTFADVAGLEEAVEELRELKDYLVDPERFRRLGAALPRGVLLVGPPGTGKTLLTKALAGEAGIPFQVVSAASLVEVYVGVGPARVRQVFAQARKQAPSIILLDELDAIGRTRARQAAGGQEERESTLNQLLLEMDGFDPASGVLVVGATNRPDVLDAALLRPGRFDRRLYVQPPDLKGRRAILEVHARNKPLGAGASLDAVARRTTGFTGADLANVMNEAALLSGRRHKSSVGAEELEEAIDRSMGGPERRSQVITAQDKRMIAYHEAGHAVVGWALAAAQDVHRMSIVARGQSHGYTLSVPTEDRVILTRTELEAQVAVLLGGRVAEELVFAEPTTGAEEDLARATELANKMVRDYGMSRALRLGVCPDGEGSTERAATGVIPSLASSPVDREVTQLLENARARAWRILSESRSCLDALAERLVEVETLGQTEIGRLLAAVPRASGATKAAQHGASQPAGLRGPLNLRSRIDRAPAAS
ncbi:MAG TPA: ATP-dependent zinc metalloprotease FtsH [Acidimicrobiales bacterium]|nr:ATP-dependent zinc metalloprotease FtsH [Acidimicrobiales bacterium]